MAFQKVYEDFQVEIVENGRKDEYGDRIYSYRIISSEPEEKVLEFCQKILKQSFPKEEKPNVLSPELIEFKNRTNLNDSTLPEMYSYKVKVTNTA